MIAITNTIKEKLMNAYKVSDTNHGTQTVRAAYFQEEGRFVVFKDDKHAACFMIRAESVTMIERVDVNV